MAELVTKLPTCGRRLRLLLPGSAIALSTLLPCHCFAYKSFPSAGFEIRLKGKGALQDLQGIPQFAWQKLTRSPMVQSRDDIQDLPLAFNG